MLVKTCSVHTPVMKRFQRLFLKSKLHVRRLTGINKWCATGRYVTILSRVQCSATNNNGFWSWWLDLLALLLHSLLITINYSAITNLPTSQISRTCSILVLVLLCTLLSLYSQLLPASEFLLLQPLCTHPRESTAYIVDEACLPRRCLAMDSLLLPSA
jgi:hypothetical protein